jgi:hypothetical protein
MASDAVSAGWIPTKQCVIGTTLTRNHGPRGNATWSRRDAYRDSEWINCAKEKPAKTLAGPLAADENRNASQPLGHVGRRARTAIRVTGVVGCYGLPVVGAGGVWLACGVDADSAGVIPR